MECSDKDIERLWDWRLDYCSAMQQSDLVGWSLGACRLGARQLGQMTIRRVVIIFPS
jgi:hypothetical protein